MVDAQEHSKFPSKHRWRAKIFSSNDAASKEPKAKPQQPFQLNDDVNDFLKPSTEKAQAHKEVAAAAFLTAGKPRIDVAKAQRWPGASEIIATAGGKSPGIGGLKTGRRKKGLTVSFVRAQPDIIGEGGDECEEPSIEVYRRKKSNSMSDVDRLQAQSHQDDMNVGARSPKFNGMGSANQDAAQRGIVTRTMTSHGEMSPPLKQKLEMGHINTHAVPPPPPPQRLGQMGLGERPKPLTRAPTGFDLQDEAPGRPSMDSTYSHDSELASPVLSKKAPSLAPTIEEEDFKPMPLKRTQTGWSEIGDDSDNAPTPAISAAPRLPEMNLAQDESPLDDKAMLADRFLQSESPEPSSFSARILHKMRVEEGKALHEAARRATEDSKRDSGSSSESFPSGSTQPNAFQVGTPPSSFTPMAGKTPPRLPPRESPPQSTSPQTTLDVEDPHRSRARGSSPGRRPMPPGTLPLDTDPRPPSSSSSQYTMPSAASRTRGSPTNPADTFQPTTAASYQSAIEKAPYSAASIPPSTTSSEHTPYSALSQSSILPTPPQYERPTYMSPQEQPPPPPPHTLISGAQTAPSQIPMRPRQESAASAGLARSDTKSQGEIAFADFSERVTHMKGIFRLTAELGGRTHDHTPMEWLRVAIWWFLKGRAGMEHLIRSRPKGGEPIPERLTQPHVDLAKAWWILTEIVKNHPSLSKYAGLKPDKRARSARDAGDAAIAEVFEAHDIVFSNMKMLLGSMKRHQSMPPTSALIQGQDQKIWEEYPRFAPDAHSVLSGTASKSMLANSAAPQHLNPASYIPLGDTKADFCYFRMFVNASLSTDDPNTDRVPLPAVVSVLRPREDFAVKLSICSQSELINVIVSANPDAGATWKDVTWKSKSRAFNVQLRHGFNLNVELTEQDFRSLWTIVDHVNRVDSNLRERSDERLTYKTHLREASYKDPTNPGIFPPEAVKGCRLLVFEKFERSTEGTGRRKLHRGYRLVLVTDTKNRTLSCVAHELGTKQEPMNFEYNTNPADQAPAITLRFKEETPDKKQKMCKMYLVFNDSKDRNGVFGTFTSMNMNTGEAVFAQVPLKAFTIESADPAEGFSQSGGNVLKRLQWQETKAMNQDPEAAGLEAAPTVMSESLRILCRHSAGVISDRMNLGPGELLIRLPIDGAAELSLLRNPQQDMAVAIDGSRVDKDIPDALAELLRTLTNASTIRKLTFNSFRDLHTFQLAVTGFAVKFDGIASTFSISRRRMVVPIYKQWTANTIRLQIVEQDNIVQLLAFFEEFSHADAMNFQLKSMDVFEKIDKSGKACVRLVDAKFALPVEERRGEGKMGKEEGRISGWAGTKRRFVCLDQIEYPGEHDDILIAFDSAETRDRFAEALPAVTQVERKFTVRRKI